MERQKQSESFLIPLYGVELRVWEGGRSTVYPSSAIAPFRIAATCPRGDKSTGSPLMSVHVPRYTK